MRKRYENLDGVDNHKTLSDMLRWAKERRQKKKDLSNPIPHTDNKRLDYLHSNRTQTSMTWIGHSTFLIQMKGLNILTDPVWGRKMGFSRRLTEPGLSMEELPPIDVVVISHGHYDHLEFPTLKKLRSQPTFYVPAGLKAAFLKKGFRDVRELNWWEHEEHGPVQIHFVPAQHWTRRSLADMNTSHWGGWIFRTGDEAHYFVGDTGYFRGFREIAGRFAIDTVLMPIGAYEPEWFMKESHINPEDAVKAFVELRARTFVPMHYGAYRLADDTGPEALDRLYREWERSGLPAGQLKVLKIGETLVK